MRLWIWHNLRIELPEEWEMLQFSRNPEKGRCAFADRYRFRFEIDWRRVASAPDFDRMMSDYASKLKDDGTEDLTRVNLLESEGLTGITNEHIEARFGRFLPEENYLVELVFIWPKKTWDRGLTAEVIGSLETESAGDTDFQRWRAFGMDLLTHSGSEIEDCRVLPADVDMSFSSPDGRVRERFDRRGMVTEWLSVSVDHWLEQWLPATVRADSRTADTEKDHHVFRFSGTIRRRGVRGVLGGRNNFEAAAWLCPSDDRLYSVSSEWSGGTDRRLRSSRRLSCCRRKALDS